jgi:Calx-beta domain/Divergent InlB B-repeat domain
MLRLVVPLLVLLACAVGATRAGGVVTLHAQVSGNGAVASNPPGINCPPECSEQFDSGSRVVLTASAGAGESFLGWGGACSGSAATCTVVADVDKNVAAKFTPGTLPAITIDDVKVTETNVDIVAVLTATLAPASAETVTVHYATADGTADSTDYIADAGTLTFAPGVTTARIPVLIKGDALDEPDETLFVDLSAPEHATIGRARGTVTIVDDPGDLGPQRILDAAVSARWNVHRRHTRVTRLVVTRAPAGAVIAVRCSGRGCPFKERRTGLKATGLFRTAKLRPGAVIELVIDSPGLIGRVFRYTIRASKAPRTVQLCWPPDAARPRAC